MAAATKEAAAAMAAATKAAAGTVAAMAKAAAMKAAATKAARQRGWLDNVCLSVKPPDGIIPWSTTRSVAVAAVGGPVSNEG